NLRRDIHIDRVQVAVFPGAKLCHVVRTAGFCASSHDGFLPATEGLALHNRAGNPAVDISIADFDVVDPVAQFFIVKRMNAARESKACGILPLDGFFQGLSVHDAQDRSEALVEVVPRTRLDRKSTRLNSSHVSISYAVCCFKKKIY